jgi:predicted transposase/invertase (TIGR01784 family)
LVEEAIKMDVPVRKAEEKLALVSSGKEALRAYQMREMALSGWTSGVNFACGEGRMEGWNEGLNEGLRKGRMESQYEIAGNFKAMGIYVDQIAQATGLSPDEIAKL